MEPAIGIVKIDHFLPRKLAISVVSDLHIESPLCQWEKFAFVMRKRTERFGDSHRLIFLGDTFDAINWRDDRRFRPSGQIHDFAGRDDFIESAIEYAAKKLKSLPVAIDLVTPGNHEDFILRRFGVDLTAELAKRIGARKGTYCGMISYPLGDKAHYTMFTIVYHHGAWGGRYAKGFIGAKHFFSQFDGWDVAVYGHNHGSVVHRERRFSPSRNYSRIEERHIHIINTCSWVDSTKSLNYSVIHGHDFAPTGSPLIIAEARQHNSIKGNRGWNRVDVTVEL